MATLLVDLLLRSDDIKHRKENILSFLSSKQDQQCIDCDYLESLNIVVSNLLDFPTTIEPAVFNKIVTETCIPALRRPRPTTCDEDRRSKIKVLELTYEVVSKIVCKGPSENARYIWCLVFKSLQNFCDECKIGFDLGHEVDESLLPVATSLDLLAYLLDNINNWDDGRLKFTHEGNSELGIEETVLNAVIDVLGVVESEGVLFKITRRILPQLLSIKEETLYRNTKIIWELVKTRLQEKDQKQCSFGLLGSYAILSSLADLYCNSNSENVFKIHRDPVFWSMIQAGLVNIDSLVRKRSLYLLQRVVEMCKEENVTEKVYLEETSPVFWWDRGNAEEILDIWHQFVFFLETLEEKQLHVIQPVLPRIEELIEKTRKTEVPGFPSLHTSWLTVIIHRAAIHENRFIKKWGVMVLLTLNLNEVPLLENTVTTNFTCDTFIMLLKEPTLYAKNHGESKAEPSALTKRLLGFLDKCFQTLDEELKRVEFFKHVLTSISHYNLSHVPLTFVSQSLSNVPRFASFDNELLKILRDIISNMFSHSVVLRGAVKTFLLRTFINFVKPTSVSVEEVLVFLGSFGKEESLCRGTQLWSEITEWLSQSYDLFLRETKEFFTCVSNLVRSFLKNEYSCKSRQTAEQLAKFLLLCYDCLAISKNEINQIFEVVFQTIKKTQSNVYHPVYSCWQAVELLHGLFHELLREDKKCTIADDITITLIIGLHEILESITQTLVRSIAQEDEYSSFHGYSAFFVMLERLKYLWLTQKFPENIRVKIKTLLTKLADVGISLFKDETNSMSVKHWLHLLVSLKLIIWVIGVADDTDFFINEEQRNKFLKYVSSFKLSSNLCFPNAGKGCKGTLLKEDNWRVVAEDIIATKWQCFNLAIKESDGKIFSENSNSSSETLVSSSCNEIVEACVESLSLASGSACYPCLETLQLCLPKLIEARKENTTILLLETSWSLLNEIRTRYSGDFWLAFDIVVKIIFAPELLILPSESILVSYVIKYWSSLLSIADDQSGLVSVVVTHLCKVFSSIYSSKSFDVMSLNYHADIIADICLFGPIHKKDKKLLLETAAYVRRLGEDSGVVGIMKFKEYESESARVRVDLLAFLLNMDYNNQTSSFFIFKLLRILLEKDQMLSEIKASRFLNSENHRKKQRLWQIILILVSRITDEKFAEEFSKSVLKALKGDNQTSVRFFMEWSLVRLFSNHILLVEIIWKEMKNLYKTRLGYVASLISVVTHLFLTQQRPKFQIEYLRQLIPAIVPCAFLNHSQIRAYILSALQLISETCSESVWCQISQQFPIMQSCLLFSESVVEGVKEKERLQKDRDLFSLHPVNDFCVEVVFKTVPLITGVVDDEVINPGVFQFEGSDEWVEASDFPLYRRDLKNKCHQSCSNEAQHEICGRETISERTETSSASSVSSDVQKKITPWNVIAPPQEDQDSFDQLRQRPIERRVGDLVVIASLIDRAPNLGGLCRTCEIFGASRLVLGSKHVVSEKDFKSVSVSSEKWVDIEEVKMHDLEMYLIGMKKEGFTVVGVEQTAQSKKLTTFQFPRSTVLVLGNEKAGIPVDIIQLLDECVEIPQHGIIRSLNVHVSGALLIWEYSRQHLNDK